MKPYLIDIDPANVDADGIADALPTGTAWSLSGDAEWLASSSGEVFESRLPLTLNISTSLEFS